MRNCSILLVLLLAPSASDEELARSGRIWDAPVKASLQLTIHAPVGKVWALLTDVDHWPSWQSDISQAAGPPQSGTDFSWTIDGDSIHSRIAALDRESVRR